MNQKTAKKLRKEARKYQRDTFGQFDLAFKCLNSQTFLRRHCACVETYLEKTLN